MMHPKPARDLAPRTGDIQHVAQSGFVPQFVVINLDVIATDVDVGNIAAGGDSELDDIAREPAMTRAAADANRGGVREFETLNRNVRRAAVQIEPVGAGNLRATHSFSANDDAIGRRAG